jgi:DNA mismatch repair protein MutS
VDDLFKNFGERQLLRKLLSEFSDLERLNVKISTQRVTPRDLIHLKNSLSLIPEINDILQKLDTFKEFKLHNIRDLKELLETSLNDEAPINVGTGLVFKSGFNSELDEYLEAKFSGKNWIKEYQESERLRTEINSLKVGFNNVFGYYIEITKVHNDKVPEDYQRRQTLTNSERYITPELKEIESKILGAEEKINQFEHRLFEKLRNEILTFSESLFQNSELISKLDCLLSFAQISHENNYIKPIVNDSTNLKIIKGRHPVVEKTLPLGETFTSNDTLLDTENEQIQIITGPNMSGKSCYLRQNALIVLMAQIGCFVPAKSAEIGLVDRIFTRVGAQDNISLGESTFLVEMQETANIINNSTERSLILLDEVGRGTATYDGLSIAWSLA